MSGKVLRLGTSRGQGAKAAAQTCTRLDCSAAVLQGLPKLSGAMHRRRACVAAQLAGDLVRLRVCFLEMSSRRTG